LIRVEGALCMGLRFTNRGEYTKWHCLGGVTRHKNKKIKNKGQRLCGQGEAMVDLSHLRLPKLHFDHKLKALKVDLKVWNEHMFGNVEARKKTLLD